MTTRLIGLEESGLVTKYSASLITNGFLLSDRVASRLSVLRIGDVQVTVDGPPTIHDQRRVLKRSNRGTFEQVISGALRVPEGISLSIRMNVDRSNADQIQELFAALEQRGAFPRVTVDIAQVQDFEARRESPPENLSNAEFAAVWQEALATAREMGWPMTAYRPRPSIRGVCQVDARDAFVVAPTGELYRCWAELGNSGHSVGSVNDRESWEKLGHAPFQTRDPFDDLECLSCRLLVTCLGSCPLLRDIDRRFRTKSCPSFTRNIDTPCVIG